MTQTTKQFHACTESARTGQPTPFWFAINVLGLTSDVGLVLMEAKDSVNSDSKLPFERGWNAGLSYSLEEDALPIMTPLSEFRDNILAWLVGFVAGQYAGVNEMVSPHCVTLVGQNC